MGMTLDDIEQWAGENDCVIVSNTMWTIAQDTMRKYQKIQEILNSTSYTENNTAYYYTYDEDSRVKHIREVVEDGTN